MHVRIAVLLSLVAAVAGAVVLGPEEQVAPPVLAEANGAQENAVIASAAGDLNGACLHFHRAGLFLSSIAAHRAGAERAAGISSGVALVTALCSTGTSS